MSALSAGEQYRLRQFLGLLLEADEPETLLGVLKRIAEHKALKSINTALTDSDAGLRWYNLAIALDKVQQELRGGKNAGTNSRGHRSTRWDGDGGPLLDAEFDDTIPAEDAGE